MNKASLLVFEIVG